MNISGGSVIFFGGDPFSVFLGKFVRGHELRKGVNEKQLVNVKLTKEENHRRQINNNYVKKQKN